MGMKETAAVGKQAARIPEMFWFCSGNDKISINKGKIYQEKVIKQPSNNTFCLIAGTILCIDIRANKHIHKLKSRPKSARQNSADFLPTSNLVCIKEVAFRTTFSHMINIA